MTAPTLSSLPEIVPPAEEGRGRIVVLDSATDLPFQVRRVYWIHGMAKGERRGGHAHKALVQAIVAIAGRVDFELDDGVTRSHWLLERPDQVLIVPADHWRDFTALDEGAALMVLASDPYDEADYIRDYQEFLAWRGRG